MRISDEIGHKSYFEAETSYCNDMINIAEKMEDDKLLQVLNEYVAKRGIKV